MISQNEDALICDLAEVYHVYDFRGLPLNTAAALAAGLDADSRIWRHLTGKKLKTNTWLLALCADRLGLIWWAKTKDGQRGRNRPESILAALTKEKQKEPENESFASGEEYEQRRRELLAAVEDTR